MKFLLSLYGTLIYTLAIGQNLPNIEDYPLGHLDVEVVVMPFGLDYPITIGKVSKSGNIMFDFPKEIDLPEEVISGFGSSELWMTLFSSGCKGDPPVEESAVYSFKAGNIWLSSAENPAFGVIFPVSDKKLVAWQEDQVNVDPVLGSYYELVYQDTAFRYRGNCTLMVPVEKEQVNVEYAYDLDLKSGFNFIQYRIERIHKTNAIMRASLPVKISVTNIENTPNSQWIGKFF